MTVIILTIILTVQWAMQFINFKKAGIRDVHKQALQTLVWSDKTLQSKGPAPCGRQTSFE